MLSNMECHKVPRLPRKTTWQPAWKPLKRRGFAASPIDTARPQENQRLETRRVGAPKRAFRARLPPIFTLCSFKINVFRQVFVGTSKFCNLKKSMFRARLPSIFSTSHKMPRLPRNLHLVATWRSPANAICKNTRRDTSKVLRMPRKMTMDTSKVLRLPRKLPRIFWKRRKSIAPATQNDFRHVTKHVWMSQSHACHAKRSNETFETSKNDPLCRTYHRHGHIAIARTVANGYERLRTVANGCGRLRTIANGCGRLRTETQRRANTPSTPRPPEWNWNPCYAFGKKTMFCWLYSTFYHWNRRKKSTSSYLTMLDPVSV